MRSDWVHRGFFDYEKGLKDNTPSQHIRAELCSLLGLPEKGLGIFFYPVGPRKRYTFWLREGSDDHAEAQFFFRIAREYPVFSLGVSLEKGYDDPGRGEHHMDRTTWDWTRLLPALPRVLTEDVPAIAESSGTPVTVRTRASRDGMISREDSRVFCFWDDRWSERHAGSSSSDEVIEHVRALDGKDTWVDLWFAEDLAAREVHERSPSELARQLAAYHPIWRRLRGNA